MYKTSLIVICIQCIQAVFVLSDLNGRPTRGLSMLRMGKRNLSFLRMGRSYLPPLVPPSYDLPGEDINERQLMGAPRMGKDIEDYDIPRYHDERAPPVPRLGFYDEYINEIRRELASNPEDLYNNVAHSGRYLGRQKRSTDTQLTEETADKPLSSDNSDNVNKEKRALPRYGLREVDNNNNPFPRLGLYERENPFPRLGLYERATFPRLGLREEDEDERSVPMMPRLGLRDSDLLNTVEAEERALPRYGLRNAEEEKRAMSMLRMGKREEEITPNEEKRKMSMLRMGKRKMSMLRMGKRGGMSMLRMGRSQTAETPEEKRAMSMLRMGRSQPDNADNVYSDEQKRAMSMLRMGKRKMSMLRMGRSYSDSDKRAMSMLRMGRGMSMLRMGRSSPDMEDQNQISSPEEQQKRAMSMLRMGRGMSMLRMGRSANDKEEMKVTDDKRGMSMLRMGKKDETKSES